MTRKTQRSIQDPVTHLELPNWYGSTPTFFGAPLAETADDLKSADIAIFGIPWQAPTPDSRMGRASEVFSGSVLTPQAMRVNSIKYGGYLPEHDIDLFEHLAFMDYGNADIVNDIRQSYANAVQKAGDVLDAGAIPVSVGGNSGLGCLPVLDAISRRARGSIAVLNFDAHGDNQPYYTQEETNSLKPTISGNWALRMFDLAQVSPAHYHHIGLRGARNDSGTIPRFVSRGVPPQQIYTYREIKAARKAGFDEFAQQVTQQALNGAEHLWLAIDVDVLDIGVCPGFGDEPLGITVEEMIEICYQAGRLAGKRRLAGISFMAIPPSAMEMQWICIYTLLHTLAGMLQGDC